MLGSSLVVTNKTQYEQIIELNVDNLSYIYSKSQLNESFFQKRGETWKADNLPFPLEKNQFVNSEMKYELWWIENPLTKEMTKRITIKLGPKSMQEFVIVIKTPNVKRTENLLSIINIGLLTLPNDRFGQSESFEDYLAYFYDGKMRDFLNDRKKVGAIQKTTVLLAARMASPVLVCPKEFQVNDLQYARTLNKHKVIPLAVKKPGGAPL
jgi:hypothetical protein